MTGRLPRSLAPLVLVLFGFGGPAAALAQEPPASPFVEPGHWSLSAARRLHAAGLMPRGWDPAIDPLPIGDLLRAFGAAADSSVLAAAYRARLLEEFGSLLMDGAVQEPATPSGMARLRLGGGTKEGALRVGIGNEDDWTGPIRDPSATTAAGLLELLGHSDPVAAELRVGIDDDGLDLRSSRLSVETGALVVWAGFSALAIRTEPDRGLVIPDPVLRAGLGVQSRRTLTVPWLGGLRFAISLTRAERNYVYRHPWVWTSRLLVSPHRRLDVALSRAVMLGGEGNGGLTFQRFFHVLIGKHSGSFDNQVVSLSGRYRPPLAVPVEAYLEWGFEDSAGAWKDVPGILAGLVLPVVPFLPEASVGASFTWLQRSCCGNPIWYRNWAFRGGWADDGHLLGHPLGGNGKELRLYGTLDVDQARVQLEGGGFARSRGSENVFAPDRQGRSLGGSVGFTALLAGGWQAFGRGALEWGVQGHDWWAGTLEAGLSATF